MNKTIVSLAVALSAPTICLMAQEPQNPGTPPRGTGPEGMRFPPPPVVQALDANHDGIIDTTEITNATAALKNLDKNTDGKLTPEEYAILPGGPGAPGAPGGPGGPGGPPDGGPGGATGPGQPPGGVGGAIPFAAMTVPKNDVEKKILGVLADMNRNQSRGNMTVPEQDGRILRLLTESLGAKQVVELGTSIGYSGIWFCLGLQQTGGKLMTFDIDAKRAEMARANFKRAGVEDKVTLIEGDAHETIAKVEAPIDIVFLDADKEGYIDYLNKLLPKVRPGGLIIAHNMNQRQADPKYVKAITTNPDLETVFVNMTTSGIGVSMKKR